MSLLPNILTGCNMAAGLFSIYYSLNKRIYAACCMVLICAVFDGLDGWAARRLDQESGFGKIFDSAADFISFGCAPAVAIYCSLPHEEIIRAIPIMFLYISASALRLIRFTVNGSNGLSGRNNNFGGLPTTASALVLVSFILFFPQGFHGAFFYMPVFLILSALMLSRISFLSINDNKGPEIKK